MLNHTFVLLSVLSLLVIKGVSAQESVKLYAIDCGTIHVSDMKDLSHSGVYDGEAITLANPCFLIRHPKGELLWDTGFTDLLADSPEGEIYDVWHSLRSTKLTDELAKLELAPEDIDYLALSHAHPDHSGNANLFAKATWISSHQEHEYMFAEPAFSYFGAGYTQLQDAKPLLFDQQHDVFGDQSIIIYALPGHTPGSAVLMVNLKRAGTILLSGDLYVHSREVTQGTMHKANVDREKTKRSRATLASLAEKHNARIIIQHDNAHFSSLPKFPGFID